MSYVEGKRERQVPGNWASRPTVPTVYKVLLTLEMRYHPRFILSSLSRDHLEGRAIALTDQMCSVSISPPTATTDGLYAYISSICTGRNAEAQSSRNRGVCLPL